ncbi:glycine zipper 2TM domain-containing protein [Alkalimonas collagenimarina]|uniref:Glycine zipper 2TM domain-containing protein n=1 Tax=Alkalimonas collagenimarina TaxID=400390 RepID=A0ABT9GZB5_9GAMM|nr:glycine zipper 2TM domain-containing protein [Alkalimonas collagenimarina]MDP4536400.1 glycine zipper 2TM domain-containing protein [Alkalimonas collagenimarina]
MKLLPVIFTLSAMVTAPAIAYNQPIEYARVTKVEPIYRTIATHRPQQVCHTETVQYRGHTSQDKTPVVLGAIVGGALGHAIGHNKSNKRVGMAAGAILGGAVVNDVQRQNRQSHVVHQQHCRPTNSSVEYRNVLEGYEVSYKLRGRHYQTVLDYDPGPRLPVQVRARRGY